MSDADFLQLYVRQFNLMHSHVTYAAVLDLCYKYVAISHGAAMMINKSIKEHLGLDFIGELPRPDWVKDKKQDILNKALTTELPHSYITVTTSESFVYPSVLLCICPVKNPFTGHVVGFDLTGSEINFRSGLQIDAINKNTETNSIFRKLTAHELDILYFKCQMYSDAQVSQLLEQIYNKKTSPKTINNILRQQLYPKFDVVSMIGLIEKAKKYGIDKLNLLDTTPKETIIELPSNLYLNFANLLSI